MKAFFFALPLCIPCIVIAQDREFHLDEIYKVDKGATLQMDTNDADITITGTKRNDVHVVVDWILNTEGPVRGDKELRVEVSEQKGNLYVQQQENGKIRGIGSIKEEYTIQIEVPASMSLELRGDDDDYTIRNIEGAISLDNDDGDAKLVNCSGNSFRFNIDDGDISMDGGEGELEVEIDDGSFEVVKGGFSKIRASIDDGELHIETSLSDKGSYDFEANDADLVLNILSGGGKFNIRHDDGSIGTDGDFTMIKNEEHVMELGLPDGKASINIKGDDAKIRLIAP